MLCVATGEILMSPGLLLTALNQCLGGEMIMDVEEEMFFFFCSPDFLFLFELRMSIISENGSIL